MLFGIVIFFYTLILGRSKALHVGLLCEHAVRGLSQVRPIGMGSGCEM